MADYLTNDTELTSIANAIRSKSGSSGTMEFPDGFVSAIGNIPTGGGSSGDKTVVFFDGLANNGEGGVVTSYTPEEFAALSAMPANPDHSTYSTHGISIPMTSQGWNWSLADAKAYVAKYGALNIGQMYVPTDGKTHYICYVPTDAPPERWNTEIGVYAFSKGGIYYQIDNEEVHVISNSKGPYYPTVYFPSIGWHDVKISSAEGVDYYPYFNSTSMSNERRGKIQRIINVFLGNRVTKTGNYSFLNCYSLELISIPNGVKYIDAYTFNNCYNLKNVIIPSGVETIGNSAFYTCTCLRNAIIPASVETMGSSAFSNCRNIKSLMISEGVTSIESNLCNYCNALISVIIPDGVTTINAYAFQNCYCLSSINIPNGVTSIGNGVFQSCYNLASIELPDSVTNIGTSVFSNCYNLAFATLPDEITSISDSIFQNCYNLASITIPSEVTSIGVNAFSTCYKLMSIEIPNSVTSISNGLFNNCVSLSSINIPNGVTSIGNTAFQYCYGITSIRIPSSVTQIGTNAFNYCQGLKSIIIETSTPPTLTNANTFLNLSSDYLIIVPQGSLSAYTSEPIWSDLASHIVEAT